jgi:hypothetical protein
MSSYKKVYLSWCFRGCDRVAVPLEHHYLRFNYPILGVYRTFPIHPPLYKKKYKTLLDYHIANWLYSE